MYTANFNYQYDYCQRQDCNIRRAGTFMELHKTKSLVLKC